LTLVSNLTRYKGDPQILQTGPSSVGPADTLGKALGWFSIGLGAIELFTPRRVTHALGMEGGEALVRAYGVRELAAGVLSLSVDKEIGLQSRIAGDALDIATLVAALATRNRKRENVFAALAMVVGITVLDVIGAKEVAERHNRKPGKPRNYGDRSGFPKGIEAARAAANR
jgi:hypothetical protein